MADSEPSRCPAFSDCSLPVDVILRSKSGESFGAHIDCLSRCAGAFPSPDILASPSAVETVDLDESSEVIMLILQFTHPERPPDTQLVNGQVMLEFAEAAEKFIVFPAMEVCSLRLAEVAKEPRYAMDVLQFGIRHDRPRLRNVAAPHTLSLFTSDVMEGSRKHFQSPQAFAAWARFRDVQERLKLERTRLDALKHRMDEHATEPNPSQTEMSPWDSYELGHEELKHQIGRINRLEIVAGQRPFNFYYDQEMTGKFQ